jgi:cell wall-associated NlpC family hydrolase
VRNGRKSSIIALLAFAIAAAVGLVPFGPAQADPDIEDVRARVDRLYHEAEQATERHHDVELELDELRSELKSLRADESRQDGQLTKARSDVREAIIKQHQGQSLNGAGELLGADSEDFWAKLSTVATVNKLQDSKLSSYNNELQTYVIRREETADREQQIAKLEKKLAAEKKTADSKLSEAEGVLSELEAEQREAVLSRGDTPTTGDLPPASGRAKVALQYAMAQVGKAYVYGAAGPSAFDCSGLTMMAWGAAGVGLPHSSSAQYGSGAQVSQSQLQPGDLVFYYSPISHVGIYIGNGMIVHAANPSSGVRVDPLNSMPYVGAVRPG